MDGEDELAKFSNVEFEADIPTTSAPTKPGHTFVGWDTIPSPAKMPAYDLDIQAKWNINKYTVTFVDEDGETVIKAATAYDYGTPADEIDKPTTPTKAATAQYTYTFAGWTPTIAKVTKDVTYKATYSETVNTYMIKFMNDDGTTLQSNNLLYGETPTYM
jgi:hypothetical protein